MIATGSNERGVILIVVLVMLLLLTMFAVSSFKLAAKEERGATSAAQHTIVFQTADAAVENVLNSTANLSSALMSNITVTPSFDGGTLDTDALVSLKSTGPAPGYSLREINGYSSYTFDIKGTAELERSDTDVVARAYVSQGIRWIGPSVSH